MKKIALAAAIAATMFVGAANAYTINQEASGLVVPNVIHNAGDTFLTTVGIVSRNSGTVYWVFYDENSQHVADGSFPVTANDQHNFIWNAATSGLGLDDKRGYLVFTLDVPNAGVIPDGVIANGDRIGRMSGNAFQVDLTGKDVAFVPTIPLVLNAAMLSNVADATVSDYVLPVNLTTMTGASVQSARLTSVDAGDRMDIRYFIDNMAAGDDTVIAFWTADEMATPVVWTANMYNTTQQRQSVNFTLPKKNMNAVDVETIPGRPATFLDGFIEVTMPSLASGQAPGLRAPANTVCLWGFEQNDANPLNVTPNCVGGVMSYSVISSPTFGAVQTMMAAHN